jgi:hypothetical protein
LQGDKYMKNAHGKVGLFVLLLTVFVVGALCGTVGLMKTYGAANTAETGSWSSADGFQTWPISIKWPLSTDVSELITIPSSYGPPIGYRQIQFQDQDLPAGGYADDATQGSGAVAEELENCFIILEEYGGTGIEANQITVYRQEFDGTAATTDSVVSWGELIFSPIEDYFDPAL